MKRTLITIVVFGFLPSIARAARCTDIAKVNFADGTLAVAGIHQTMQIFHFHHGVSLEYEGGDKKPDWRTTIRHDVVVKPEASRAVRFLTLFRNHLTGSGSWTYLVGLACSGGHVQQVFQSAGVYMQVVKISPMLVQVSMPVWKPADPTCCPSEKKEVRYTWEAKTHRYVLARTE
ncbi:MAG TPA: LppP/LprE family lipoprotein [Terriglobia bacterium]|nr:LppP/LprE family lipoprotein [Terriglobia bacterium]